MASSVQSAKEEPIISNEVLPPSWTKSIVPPIVNTYREEPKPMTRTLARENHWEITCFRAQMESNRIA
jgi:hypothetical protein